MTELVPQSHPNGLLLTGEILVNGEKISPREAYDIVKMLYNDAKQMAGEFHGMNRSDKFRTNWPDEYKFADANWKTFVEPTRQYYAMQLGDEKVPQDKKRKMHLALVLDAMMAQGQEKDTRLQIFKDTAQFHGDAKENRAIVDKFGTGGNLRAALMNSTASRH